MMNFFLKHCSKSASLIKTDDDVSIHLDRMLEKWKHLDDSKIFCRLWRGHEPLRDPASKWYVSISSKTVSNIKSKKHVSCRVNILKLDKIAVKFNDLNRSLFQLFMGKP